MRILITGASGQLGSELKRCLRTMHSEIGSIPDAYTDAEVVCTDAPQLDITDASAVDACVREGAFDLIINCAAMTDVDGCEASPDAARRVNADGAENLARAAAATGAKLVQVSTDYVFPGNEPGERTEVDAVSPLSTYGRTKLEGEQRALAANPRTFIVRTAWLYGYVGKNFVKTMLRLGATHEEVTVVDDQLGNPTSANDLAHTVLELALTEDFGIYHCTNNGICSWADLAQAVMEHRDLACDVMRCTSEEYKRAHPASADRPRFSALDNAHLRATVGDNMRDWKVALCEYLDNLEEREEADER